MLNGKNIKLRALEPEDSELLYDWENDTSIWNVTNTYIPFSKDALKNYILSVKDIFTDKQFRFVIVSTENNNPVGLIDLFEFDPYHLRAGVGIMIASSERGNGYATEALDVLVKYSKEILRLKSLFCNILVSNEKSIALFEKAGFVENGKKKQWFRNGEKWEDENFYQIHF